MKIPTVVVHVFVLIIIYTLAAMVEHHNTGEFPIWTFAWYGPTLSTVFLFALATREDWTFQGGIIAPLLMGIGMGIACIFPATGYVYLMGHFTHIVWELPDNFTLRYER